MAKLHNWLGKIKSGNIKPSYRPANPAVIIPASGGPMDDFRAAA
jgi:hypothetical protein